MPPSLSELSAIYHNQPYAPAAGTNQLMGQGFSALGGAIDQGRETARQNRPVTPWEKAVMRLMQGHDPKAVAADTKGELAGAGAPPPPGAPMGAAPQGGAPASPGGISGPMLGPEYQPDTPAVDAAPQMPAAPQNRRPLPAAAAYASERTQGMAPQGQQGLGDLSFDSSNMTHRDYNDYVDAMSKVRTQKLARSQTDLMEIERLRAQNRLDVEDKKGNTKKEVEGMRNDFRNKNLTSLDKHRELTRRMREKELDEKTANDVAEIDLGYAKIQERHDQFEKSYGQKDRLAFAKMLVDLAKGLDANFARVQASLTGLAGMPNADLVADLESKRKEVEEAKAAAQAEIEKQRKEEEERAKQPDTTVRTSGERHTGPAGVRQPKRTYRSKDGTRTIQATEAEYNRSPHKADFDLVK